MKPLSDWLVDVDDIPLTSLSKDKRPYTIHDDTTDDDDDDDDEKPKTLKRDDENIAEARRLLRTLTNGPQQGSRWQPHPRSGSETPAVDKHLHDLDYVPPPNDYRPGVFGAILSSKLADLQQHGFTHPRYHDDSPQHHQGVRHDSKDGRFAGHSRANSDTYAPSYTSSGRATPSGRLTPSSKRPKWYEKPNHSMSSMGSMATLLASASAASAAPAAPSTTGQVPRPHLPRSKSSNSMIATAVDMIKHPGNVSFCTQPCFFVAFSFSFSSSGRDMVADIYP